MRRQVFPHTIPLPPLPRGGLIGEGVGGGALPNGAEVSAVPSTGFSLRRYLRSAAAVQMPWEPV